MYWTRHFMTSQSALDYSTSDTLMNFHNQIEKKSLMNYLYDLYTSETRKDQKATLPMISF